MTRILFLHGYTQSGNTLRHKTGALSKALAKYAEIVYPTGPIKMEMPDTSDPAEREKLAKLGNEETEGAYAWWRFDPEKKEFVGLDSTLAMIKELLETEGPFDGVMGFSQGGGLAAILASLLERPNSLLETSHPPFKFAVIFSGFRSYFPRHNFVYDPPIKTPMLHVIGKVDPIVTPERSQDLVECSAHAEVLNHPGSHFVPSAAAYKSKVTDFVLAHTMSRRGMTAIVAATDNNLGIGQHGGLPWRLKKEMKYFADVTSQAPTGKQNVVIMGRNSWVSIPEKFRPLKNRINIVITSNPTFELTGTAVKSQQNCLAQSLDDALLQIEKQFSDIVHKVFVIGGAQLYKAALEHADLERILFTSIKNEFECDVQFPVDFRARRKGESPTWKKRRFDDLIQWTGVDVSETEVEKDVEWDYEMWEKDDGIAKL